MPRDRLGLFASSLIPAYVRRTEGTERSVIDLFDLGLINSEITEAVDRMFGAKVSKGIVQKEAVHIALGIRTDGTKEILDYSIAPNESRTNWKDMIVTIRERVALFCTDGLNGSTNMQNSFNKGIRIYTKFLTLSFFQILDYSFT
jgi:transposase-like protein